MRKKPSLVCLVAAVALPCIAATVAHAQAPYQPAPPAPTAAPAMPPQAAAGPAAAAPMPAPAQPAPVPGYYPPPGYVAPAPYPAPPGYYPPPGYAQPGYYPPPGYYAPVPVGPPPGYHEHDGFYMRLITGMTVLNASWKGGNNDYSITGAGMALGMALGGSITPNLVLYGEFVGSVAMEPSRKINGDSQTLSGYNVTLFGIGPGVAYYLPSNLYLSGSLLFSQLTESDNGSSNNSSYNSSNNSVDLTDTGIGASFMVGKEWWVSTNWGLGVAGMLHLASMKMKNWDTRATAEAISILFSATYN